MGGVKIGIGFGQWKYGLPDPELLCTSAEIAEDMGSTPCGCRTTLSPAIRLWILRVCLP